MIIAKRVLLVLLLSLSLMSCKKTPEIVLTPLEEKLASMTLDEKLGQMIQAERNAVNTAIINQLNLGSILSGGGSHPSPNTVDAWLALTTKMNNASKNGSAGLPLLYGVDAVHGHNNVEGLVLFPHNSALGATHDENLLERIGQAVGVQLRATGIAWNFAPCLAVVQDIRWGRAYEGFSEEPNLVASLGAAYIKGLQSEGIMATAKHYLADGGTDFDSSKNSYPIDQGNVSLTEAEVRALHLIPYIKAIQEGNVKSIMVSFSSINNQKMHGSKYWITTVLKEELEFDGIVISDWEAIHQLPGSLIYQVSSAINAGVDMLMEPYQYKEVLAVMKRAVENGTIKMERIDDAVMRILKVKDDLKLSTGLASASIDMEGDKALAREAVAKSQVLLKNDGVLPLAKNTDILLIGPGIDNVGYQAGGWSFSWQGEKDNTHFPNATTLLEAFTAIAQANGARVYTQLKDASKADVVVLVLTEDPYAEGVGDTKTLSLTSGLAHPDNADAIRQAKLIKKPVITLLMSGRPLIVADELEHWDAFVMSWLFGTEAQGVTDVLYGDVNFSGTLSFTWPKIPEANTTSSMNPDRKPDDIQFEIGSGLTY